MCRIYLDVTFAARRRASSTIDNAIEMEIETETEVRRLSKHLLPLGYHFVDKISEQQRRHCTHPRIPCADAQDAETPAQDETAACIHVFEAASRNSLVQTCRDTANTRRSPATAASSRRDRTIISPRLRRAFLPSPEYGFRSFTHSNPGRIPAPRNLTHSREIRSNVPLLDGYGNAIATPFRGLNCRYAGIEGTAVHLFDWRATNHTRELKFVASRRLQLHGACYL